MTASTGCVLLARTFVCATQIEPLPLVVAQGPITVGTPAQTFTVLAPVLFSLNALTCPAAQVVFDTGSATLWVPSVQCTDYKVSPGCQNHFKVPLFTP